MYSTQGLPKCRGPPKVQDTSCFSGITMHFVAVLEVEVFCVTASPRLAFTMYPPNKSCLLMQKLLKLTLYAFGNQSLDRLSTRLSLLLQRAEYKQTDWYCFTKYSSRTRLHSHATSSHFAALSATDAGLKAEELSSSHRH